MTSGRLVEYEGACRKPFRSVAGQLQQEMFAEVNPKDANNAGVRNGDYMWVETPEQGPFIKTAFLHLVKKKHFEVLTHGQIS